MKVTKRYREEERRTASQRDVHQLDERGTAHGHSCHHCQPSEDVLRQADAERCGTQHVQLMTFILEVNHRATVCPLPAPLRVRGPQEYSAGILSYVDTK